MTTALAPLALTIGEILEPLVEAFGSRKALAELLRALGYDPSWLVDGALPAFDALTKALGELPEVMKALRAALQKAKKDGKVSFSELIDAGKAVYEASSEIIDAFSALDYEKLAAPAPFNTKDLWLSLRDELLDLLLLEWLSARAAPFYHLLRVVGVVQDITVMPDEDAGRVYAIVPQLRMEVLEELVKTDGGAIFTRWGFGADEGLQAKQLLLELHALALALGARSRLEPARQKLVESATFKLVKEDSELAVPFLATHGTSGWAELGLLMFATREGVAIEGVVPPRALVLSNLSFGTVKGTVYLDDAKEWSVEASATAEASAVVGAKIQKADPDAKVEVLLVTDAPTASVSFTLTGAPETPWVIIGTKSTSRLEVLGVKLATVLGTSNGELDFSIDADLYDQSGKSGGARIVIDTQDADNFLSKVLGGKPFIIDADLGFGWSTEEGLRVTGGLGAELSVPIQRSIGPVNLKRLDLELSVYREQGDERYPLWFAAGLAADATLGPLFVSVDGLGLIAAITTLTEDGALRPGELRLTSGLGLQFRFKPPTGFALQLQAEVVTGGGVLKIDTEKGRYFGGLELQTPMFGIGAIALITVRPKDAEEVEGPKWSMLMSLDVTFRPALQLGMGFVLESVGGMFGANRRLDDGALRLAAREGRLDALLTPEDIVKNADTILKTWEEVFPAQEGSFVLGPKVGLGWGAPSPLIRANLALLVSFPSPVIIAVLGRVSCELPKPASEDKPALVSLKMDVAGVLNLGERTLSVDASLVDSRIAIFDVSGGMALRLAWGDKPSFLLSIGGFHPDFEPPAELTELKRLGFGMSFGGTAKGEETNNNGDTTTEDGLVSGELAFGGYFAITPNTLQFGAFAHLNVDIWKFSATAEFDFDTLIQFKPFSLRTSLHFELAVSYDDEVFAGFWFDGALSGPAPTWRFQGAVGVKFLCFKAEVDVDATFGEPYDDQPVEVDVAEEMRLELASARAWEPVVDRDVLFVERLDALDDELWMSPGQPLRVRQHVAPLGRSLEHLGGCTPSSAGPWSLRAEGVEGEAQDLLKDHFARGQFQELSDDERLRLPAFERFDAGVELPVKPKRIDKPKELKLDEFEVILGESDDDLTALGGSLTEALQKLQSALTNAPNAAETTTSVKIQGLKLGAPAFDLIHPVTGKTLSSTGQDADSLAQARAAGGRLTPSRAA